MLVFGLLFVLGSFLWVWVVCVSMAFIANVYLDSGVSSVDEIPDEFVVETSQVSGSTVSVEVDDVVGVAEMEFSDSVSIDFVGGVSVQLDDARLMGAGEESGY